MAKKTSTDETAPDTPEPAKAPEVDQASAPVIRRVAVSIKRAWPGERFRRLGHVFTRVPKEIDVTDNDLATLEADANALDIKEAKG